MSRLFVLLLGSLFSALPAQQYTAEYIMEQIQTTYLAMEGASAQFQQTTLLRFGKQGQVQSGTVKIRKGNKYRIETHDQLVITDGKTIWILSKLMNQVLIDDVKDYRASFSPDKLLLGMHEDFSISEVIHEKDLLKVTLKSLSKRARAQQITSMTAWVRPRTWIFEKIIYTDRNQNQFDITLSHIQPNLPLRDDEFYYVPAASMKVVDLRAEK